MTAMSPGRARRASAGGHRVDPGRPVQTRAAGARCGHGEGWRGACSRCCHVTGVTPGMADACAAVGRADVSGDGQRPAACPARGVEQLLGVRLGGLGLLQPGEHPGQLPQPAGLVEGHDPAAGHQRRRRPCDHQVLVGEGGHLRQVGDDDDLGRPGERRQPPPDLDRRLAADAGVDLVEDQGGHRVGAREHDLDGEHHPGQLAAGGALLQRPRPGAPACGRSSSSTSSTPCRPVGERPAADRQRRVARRRPLGLRRRRPRPRRGPSPAPPARRSPRPANRARPPPSARRTARPPAGRARRRSSSRRAASSADPVVVAVQAASRAAARSAQAEAPPRRPSSAARRPAPVAVLADQPGERGPPLLHDGQPRRVGLDRGGVGREVGADVGEQVAELAQPAGERGQRRVVRRRPCSRAPGRPPTSAGRVGAVAAPSVVAEQRRVRACRPRPAARRRGRAAPPRPRSAVSSPGCGSTPPRSPRGRSAAGRPPGPAPGRASVSSSSSAPTARSSSNAAR